MTLDDKIEPDASSFETLLSSAKNLQRLEMKQPSIKEVNLRDANISRMGLRLAVGNLPSLEKLDLGIVGSLTQSGVLLATTRSGVSWICLTCTHSTSVGSNLPRLHRNWGRRSRGTRPVAPTEVTRDPYAMQTHLEQTAITLKGLHTACSRLDLTFLNIGKYGLN